MAIPLFSKTYSPPGTAPGTLPAEPPEERRPVRVTAIVFSDGVFEERDIPDPARCHELLSRDTYLWIHVEGSPDPGLLQQLGDAFELHPLALEDVMNAGQRPKVERFGDQLFAIFRLPVDDGEGLQMHQASFFLQNRCLVSLLPGPPFFFEPVRQRLREARGRLRRKATDYLFYALIDQVIDHGFPVLEAIGDRIETLEEEIMSRPNRDTLRRLHELRRQLLLLRRALWPARDEINAMLRDDIPLIRKETAVYLRDCHDHAVQIIDLIETYRDMTAGMLDVYLSNMSHRTNEVMRALSIVATIFIPMTFLAGVYGMNFNTGAGPWNMPELNWAYGYPLFWAVTVLLGLGMYLLFRWKKWL